MNEHYSNSDTLQHYGVKGMKWGVRRSEKDKQTIREYRQDNKERKNIKRNLAATKQHMKQQGEIADESRAIMDSARRTFVKESTRGWLTRDVNKVKEAEERLREASKNHESNQTEFLRAKRFYETEAKKYTDKVDSMISKYGEGSVRAIKTKDMQVGSSFVNDVIKTGITLADMPIIGPKYRYEVIRDYDRKDRHDRLNERASRG